MTKQFQAWAVTRYGGPDVLKPVTCPLPEPGPKDVLIRVHASAVSRADGMMRAGLPKFARPFLGLRRPRAGLCGTCLSGEVIACGADVSRFAIGDAVFGEAGLRFGANATHIRLEEAGSLVRKPDDLTHTEAAGLFDGAITSWHFLTQVGQVEPGQRVLILGGAGALGTSAIQFAKAMGAQVAATASARNADLLEALGADRIIDYRGEDALPRGAAYDIIFDTLGIASYSTARRALGPKGIYLCPVLEPRLLLEIMASKIGGRSQRAAFAAAGLLPSEQLRAHAAQIIALVAQGHFRPVIDRIYPLSDLVEAHRYVETGRKRGNVVVVPADLP